MSIQVFTIGVCEANMLCISVSRQHSQGSGASVIRASIVCFWAKTLVNIANKVSKFYNCVHFLCICFWKIFLIHSFFGHFIINNKHGGASVYNTFYELHTSLTSYFLLWNLVKLTGLTDIC